MARNGADWRPLGAYIREQRTRLRLTQEQLAERTGWTQERISVLESGKYGLPSVPALARLAAALEVDLSALLAAAGFESRLPTPGKGAERAQVVALLTTLQQLLEIDATTVKDALSRASDLMAVAMGAEKIDAFMFDPSSASLVAVGTSNTPMGRLQHERGLDRFPLANRGPEVETYETGVPYASGDIQDDPGIGIGMKETLGIRSMLLEPLRVADSIHGVLAAASSEIERFTEDDRRFFAAAARWVGSIVHRAELMERARDTAADEARRVALDEVITALAHDLGNALTPLKGRLDLLRRGLQRDDLARERGHAEEATRSLAALQQMVNRLLDVARLDRGLFALVPQPLDLVTLIDEVAADVRATWPAVEVVAPERLEVEGDPVRLREVLANLLTNAVRHSPEGAPIAVTAALERRETGLWATVRIADRGPGIPPDLLPRLFERFASGPGSAGLGLGLYLSRRLAEAHGGTLTVELSGPGGTTFLLALPAARE